MKKTFLHYLIVALMLVAGNIQELFAQQSDANSFVAPIIIDAFGSSPQTIKVNFVDTNIGESGYFFYYSTSPDGPFEIEDWDMHSGLDSGRVLVFQTNSGYEANTLLYIKIAAFYFNNETGEYSAPGPFSELDSARTLAGWPPAPSDFIAKSEGGHIRLTWTDNSKAGDPLDEAVWGIERSTDGVNYTKGYTVPAETETFVDNDVTPYVTYYYTLEAYNAFGVGNDVYGASAMALPVAETPTVPSSNLSFSNILTTSMTVSFNPGNGTHHLAVMKAGSAPVFQPQDNIAYSGDLGNEESVVYNGTDRSFNLTTLQRDTEYFITIFEFNEDGINTRYRVNNAPVASMHTATINPPTEPTKNISFSNVLTSSMTVSFTPGNGTQRLAIMKIGSAPTFIPAYNTSYTGDLGHGESVVYTGTGNTFNLSGLSLNTNYYITIFEFNTDSSNIQYLIANAAVANIVTKSPTTHAQLFGMTAGGGAFNAGTIYKINADGTGYKVLHNFNITGGSHPNGSLIQGPGGSLYGMTTEGGTDGLGTIFKINSEGSDFKVLLNLTMSTGRFPLGDLVMTSDGSLFGMTQGGGPYGPGMIFKVNPDGSGYTAIRNFNFWDGANPRGSLIQGADGALYGMATRGGSINNNGTIFKINTDGSDYTLLHNSDGFSFGSLIQASNGSLFGMAYGNRSIFTINTDGSGYTVLHNSEGLSFGSLIQGPDGSLFGMTSDGGSSKGTIFKINTDGSNYKILYSFNGLMGSYPKGNLTINNNVLFGFTSGGGQFDGGVIFKYDLGTATYNKLVDLKDSTGIGPQYGNLLLINSSSVPAVSKPTIAAKNISFSNVLSTSMTVSFTPGNGTRRLALLRAGSAPALKPVDNTSYSGKLANGDLVVFNGAETMFKITGLSSYRRYYVTVFEYNADSLGNIKYLVNGAPVASQQTRLLPKVYVIKPGNGTVNQYVKLTLKAKEVTGANTYTFEISNNASFASAKILSGGITQMLDSLHYNTLYYTRVKTNLRDDYGKVTTFTTRTAESLAYVTSPANGAVNVNTKTAIASNAVPYASQYTIQLSETNDFSIVAFEATGSSRILHFPELKNNTTYYSRVRVNLSLVFGGVRSFTTGNTMTAARIASDGEVELPELALTVYPNPFQEKLILYIESSKYDDAKVTLMDLTGRTVHEFFGKTNSPLEIERNLVGGVYLLRVNARGFNKQVRVVKIQ